MSVALVLTGNFAEAVVHADQALALYDPVEHRPLATRFIQDPRLTALYWRSLALGGLGFLRLGAPGQNQAPGARVGPAPVVVSRPANRDSLPYCMSYCKPT